jgi:hypothetical protein
MSMRVEQIQHEILELLTGRLGDSKLVYVTSAELADDHEEMSKRQVAQGMTELRDNGSSQPITVTAWGKTRGIRWKVESDG